jgi:hypothetical protein
LCQESEAEQHREAWARIRGADGILVPGGFGSRGVEGKIAAAKYAREQRVPYLGICLGMQIAVIEFARAVLGLADANSAEFEPACGTPVVVFMPEGSTTHKGGTMRLGSRRTILQTMDCTTAKLYQVGLQLQPGTSLVDSALSLLQAPMQPAAHRLCSNHLGMWRASLCHKATEVSSRICDQCSNGYEGLLCVSMACMYDRVGTAWVAVPSGGRVRGRAAPAPL